MAADDIAPLDAGQLTSREARRTRMELEGEAPAGGTVVLQFSTMQAARAWYRSEEYNEIRKTREGAARVRMYIVDGFV